MLLLDWVIDGNRIRPLIRSASTIPKSSV